MLHVVGALLPLSETFVQERLRSRDYESAAVAWERVPDGLPVPCPQFFFGRYMPGPAHSWLRRKLGGPRRRFMRRFDGLRTLASFRPDILHVHFGTTGLWIMRDARILGIPMVVSFYGRDATADADDTRTRGRYQRLFSMVRAVTAEGPVLARRLLSIGARRETVRLLPLGLPSWALAVPKRRVSNDDAVLRLVQVCRFVEKKGVDTTLRAVAVARDAGGRLSLELIGEGPMRAEIEGLIDSLRLRSIVSLLGCVDHDSLPEVFGRAHALIQPSRYAADGDAEGGAPAVIIEAQAQGLAVLGTKHCDIPHVVVDGKTAFLSPERDHAALAANIGRLYSDRGRLAEMGRAARAFALRRHNPDLLLALRERLYREVLRRRR